MVKLRYSAEEMGRRGDLLYEREVEPRVTPADRGRVVAIDVDSGDYEIASDTLASADGLCARRPDAQIWFRRVGFAYLHRHLGWTRRGWRSRTTPRSTTRGCRR
jgi:hypothetical protein